MARKMNLFANLKADFASGLVVFLVALPLCLGIALASGAPLFSGIISGIIGGVIVGYLSKSHISVSGPTASLAAIIFSAITDFNSFNVFLVVVFIAGLIQLVLGFIKAGTVSNYFPTNVIEGGLAGMGIIIFLKQIPHALGYDKSFEGEEAFFQAEGDNTFSSLLDALNYINLGSVTITAVSLMILIFWDKIAFLKRIKFIPAALIAVVVGILINEVFIMTGSSFEISKEHLVALPEISSLDDLKNIMVFPDFSAIFNPKIWSVAFTIAIVASLETLLSIEASDRLDSQKRLTDTNVELKAQGIGNMVSSLLGGLPMASVIVRSSVNINSGAKSKMSAILHGVLLLVSVLTIPIVLNKIPLATLAAILLLVGYKLARPAIIMHFWSKGKYQFVAFIVTMLGVVFTDLLRGMLLGIAVSVYFILRGNYKRAYYFRKDDYEAGDVIHMVLAQEVSFLNKASVKNTLYHIPENSQLIIDASDTVYIAHDVQDIIKEFLEVRAVEYNIQVQLIGFKEEYDLEDTLEESNNVYIKQKHLY